MIYKYGVTGFVELSRNLARKYSYFDYLYWLKEYAILLNIWPHKTNNIITYKKALFTSVTAPNKSTPTLCYEMIFPRYKRTLDEVKFYKDRDIIQVLLDLLSGLSFLHKKKIMHRDLKPENIMIHANRAIIIDFSHSHRVRTNNYTLDKDVVTISYRAPEVFAYCRAETSSYDEKIDIWSMGIILFEMVTGLRSYNTITAGSDFEVEKQWKKSDGYQAVIKKYINCKTNLVHVKTYWRWIFKMIEYNPKSRITAEEMFTIVHEFAIDNNVSFVLPYNISKCAAKNKLISIIPVSTDRESIIIRLNKYKTIYGFQYDTEKTAEVVEYFIARGCINTTNKHTYELALAIIIDVVVYDNLSAVNNIATDSTDVKYQELVDAIVFIVKKFDKELFLYDTFDFDMHVKITDLSDGIIQHDTDYESDVFVLKETDYESDILQSDVPSIRKYADDSD